MSAEPEVPLNPDDVGPCGSHHCEHGWRRVTDLYLDRQAPWPEPPPFDATPEAEAAYEADVQRITQRRASLANTWYPCRACNPRAFFRWAGGHFASDHVPELCPECCEGLPRSRRHAKPAEPAHTAAMAAAAREGAPPDGDYGEF